MSNAVQHQTNRSAARTRTARSRRSMLYVVAVGTLISTLNQAYKSSEVHVSTRMISGGRLLALTSSGIYRYTPLATTALVRARTRRELDFAEPAGTLVARIRSFSRGYARTSLARALAIPALGAQRLCAHHRLETTSFFIRYITRPVVERPFRKLLCKHSRTCERRSALSLSLPLGISIP